MFEHEQDHILLQIYISGKWTSIMPSFLVYSTKKRFVSEGTGTGTVPLAPRRGVLPAVAVALERTFWAILMAAFTSALLTRAQWLQRNNPRKTRLLRERCPQREQVCDV